jgi:hypothetical protein
LGGSKKEAEEKFEVQNRKLRRVGRYRKGSWEDWEVPNMKM